MPQEPFFSVITVTFNAERWIERTAESLFSQTDHDFEWIVVDGLSKDRTVRLASHYARNGIDTIVSERDDGIYDAMNKGLAIARGRFVNFLNAGDCYATARVLEIVREYAAGDADIIYGDTILPVQAGVDRYRSAMQRLDPFPLRMPFFHQAMFTRRAIHGEFDCTYRLAADYDLMARLIRSGALAVHVPQPLSVNSVDAQSASIRGRALSTAECTRVWRRVIGLSPWRTNFEYAKRLLHMRAIAAATHLPQSVLSLIPVSVRRRLY